LKSPTACGLLAVSCGGKKEDFNVISDYIYYEHENEWPYSACHIKDYLINNCI